MMLKKLLTLALLAPAMAQAYDVCPEGHSYLVGPYVGLGAQATKLKLKHGLSSPTSLQPYGFIGLKVAPNLAIELGTSLKDHKLKMQDIQHVSRDGDVSITYTEHKPLVRHRKVDLRVLTNFPLDGYQDVQALLGLGVSHLKVKQFRHLASSLTHQRVVPQALLGLEVGGFAPLKFRVQATYSHGLGMGIPGVKVKGHFNALAGLVWHL